MKQAPSRATGWEYKEIGSDPHPKQRNQSECRKSSPAFCPFFTTSSFEKAEAHAGRKKLSLSGRVFQRMSISAFWTSFAFSLGYKVEANPFWNWSSVLKFVSEPAVSLSRTSAFGHEFHTHSVPIVSLLPFGPRCVVSPVLPLGVLQFYLILIAIRDISSASICSSSPSTSPLHDPGNQLIRRNCQIRSSHGKIFCRKKSCRCWRQCMKKFLQKKQRRIYQILKYIIECTHQKPASFASWNSKRLAPSSNLN